MLPLRRLLFTVGVLLLGAAAETMVVFRGNHIYATGDPEIPMSVVLTGNNVKLLAISIDGTGTVFNDVNLNRLRDPGESVL